ncbi:MAG: hypothetical protein LAO07_16835, partial [Acidobacteriia bacterium]|nr:hypothetical protein [Terriglobia bacterium]
MKNKYFGDFNDYHKYGLLRILSNQGEIGTAVHWMLTPDNCRGGRGTPKYLQRPDEYRHLDPDLFDALRRCWMKPDARSVHWAVRKGILSFAQTFTRRLPEEPKRRRNYFQRFLSAAREFQLIFFDPDTGLKWKWSPSEGEASSAHLYLDELLMTFDAGHSVLVYQQFPRFLRVPRNQFIDDLASSLRRLCRAPIVFSFRTPRVVFLLVPQLHLVDFLDRRSREVAGKWNGRIGVTAHHATRKDTRELASVRLSPGLIGALRLKATMTGQPLS